MAGFIRRYGYFPGVEQIQLIEGVVIVDLPPPGSVTGVGVGTVAVVGEFADMTYATQVDSSGVVQSKYVPVEVTSGQDLIDKVGGFDETLGKFGAEGGNGFVEIKGKKYQRLVLVPVNIVSDALNLTKAVRVFRSLPTNKGATNPVPTVPVQAATVPAGTEFKTGASRARLAARVNFTDLGQYTSGVDGSVTSGTPGVTQTFTAAGGGFLTARDGGPVQDGDILVAGVLGAAAGQGEIADASHCYGTYRVTATAAGNTSLTVELIDGASFDWPTGTTGSVAWRLHKGSDADSYGAGASLADAAGFNVPARPLDATIAASTVVAPTTAASAPTATSCDPFAGLKLKTHSSSGLVYVANLHAPNSANTSEIVAAYTAAIASLLTEDSPARDVNILTCARKARGIANAMRTHCLAATAQGVGRSWIASPSLAVQTVTAATAGGTGSSTDGSFGVAATDASGRHERADYNWPGCRTYISEAVNKTIATADGKTTTDGVLDVTMDAFYASLQSLLPPERNPGQASSPVPEVFSPILGFQRGVSGLTMNDYIALKAAGIAALRIDRTAGPIIQSGITTSLTAGQKNRNRRRMADFIEDSLAQRLVNFAKEPLTNQLKDAELGEVVTFMDGLLSPNNPAAQRIDSYSVDDKSGNTPSMAAKGIHVIIVKARTLATQDELVIQAEVGEEVEVTAQ